MPKYLQESTEQFYKIFKKKYPAYKAHILFNYGTVDISLKGKDK